MALKSWIPALFVLLFLVGCDQLGSPKPAAPAPPATQATASFGVVTKVQPDASLSLPSDKTDWYKDQVFYHVWMKAFRDSNGDGTGDIAGVTQKLDYLKDLGVTAIWLSPFFKTASSTANLHGYDVTDHYTVDPRFGTLDDVKALLKAAHDRGMRVIFDFVPNHVSNQHPWFQDSLNNRNGKKDWFVWKAAPPTQGWSDVTGSGAGIGFHAASNGQYYYGVFWDQNPDLNYRNPEVQTSMANVVIYWLNLGFDGMRVDAVRYLYENETTGANEDQPETITFFQKLRSEVLDGYGTAGTPKFMVAENWTNDTSSLQSYLRSGGTDGFQATLDFPLGYGITSILNGGAAPAATVGDYYTSFLKPAVDAGGWTFSFLSNHDNYQSRPMSAFGSVQKSRVALALQTAAWGTPVLYYGNEIGMTGYTGSDANMRTNFDWSQVVPALANPDSLLLWQKTLDQLHANRASLRRGGFQFAPSTAGTLAVVRTLGSESTLMVANLTVREVASATVDLTGVPLGSTVGTLVGDGGQSLSGATLTVTGLKPYGIRFYALEGPATTMRSDFTDGAPTTKIWAGAKDGSAAALSVSYYDADKVLLSQQTPVYTNQGGYWWASYSAPATLTSGYIEWTKTSVGYSSGLLPFTVSSPGQDLILGYPNHNTGASSTWFLRGVAGDWDVGLPMTAVAGEPEHFLAALTPSQAPAAGVPFKINAQNQRQWDYFFGYLDMVYDTALGDSPASLGYASAGGGDYNAFFRGDGQHSYEVHFVNQKGTCRVWIKKVLP